MAFLYFEIYFFSNNKILVINILRGPRTFLGWLTFFMSFYAFPQKSTNIQASSVCHAMLLLILRERCEGRYNLLQGGFFYLSIEKQTLDQIY